MMLTEHIEPIFFCCSSGTCEIMLITKAENCAHEDDLSSTLMTCFRRCLLAYCAIKRKLCLVNIYAAFLRQKGT